MGVACSFSKPKSADDTGLKLKKRFNTVRSFSKRKKGEISDPHLKSPEKIDSGELWLPFACLTPPRKSGDARKSSFLGKVGIAGLERAVEVLDALGSGVANLNSSTFLSGMTVRGNKISVLAFEVANTITKGASLLQSLSEENVSHVTQNIFLSEGVQCLVSADTNVLRSIAAKDKREELDMFCREVVRFGDLCKDAQWHKLDRFFTKLESINAARRPLREQADQNMCELSILAQHTAELYHELSALDRFEQDYRQSREEAESSSLPNQGGESLLMLQSELKHQKRLVMSLKRKSLWSKRMEEVIEKLVEVVAFIHLQISESFGNIEAEEVNKEPKKIPERLGVAGLSLHYANIIHQIDSIASRPSYLPPSTRDSLYHGLPASVKNALRSSLGQSDSKEELSVPEIKAEMVKTLNWLVPMAASTSKMHKGFGWVGEWASTSHDFYKQNAPTGNFVRLQTLYHADKEKADFYILELVKWLHLLINAAAKQRDLGLARSLQVRTTNQKSPPKCSAMTRCPSPGSRKPIGVELSKEDTNLLEKVSKLQPLPMLSKSQNFSSLNRRSFKMRGPCRSTGSSPCREFSRTEAVLLDERYSLEVLNQLDLAV